MKTLYLPDGLKPTLRDVWGIPFFGSENQVTKNVKEFCEKRKFKKVITVGDRCSLSVSSDIKIFDGKVNRKKIKKSIPFSLRCFNPAGTIQKTVWAVLKEAISKNKNVFIDGEEDLLVIPVVLLSEKNTAVLYGLFGKGICLIVVSNETKKNFKELLKTFQAKKSF